MGTFLLWLRNRVLDQHFVEGHWVSNVLNYEIIQSFTAWELHNAKWGNQAMWLKGNTKSEEGLGWSTWPAPVKAQTRTATLGLQRKSELVHTSLSTVALTILSLHLSRQSPAGPPCLTAHKRKRFWDLILSPCCVFWGNSFLLETRSPHSVP